jgi:hypothetical protein
MLVAAAAVGAAPVQAQEKMTSGWTWPVSPPVGDTCGYLHFLQWNPNYSKYHLAQDICNQQGHAVYALGDGTVVASTTTASGYGPGETKGGALVVRHQAADGTWFTALYGHLDSPHAPGAVHAGEVLGYSNAYAPPHLHLGIHPGFDAASQADLYLGYTDNTAVTHGYVDPLPFLAAHPAPSTTTALPDLTISAGIASGYPSGKQSAQANVTVYRTGGDLTRGTYVTAGLYWSTDNRWDAGDPVLWTSNGSTPDFPNAYLNANGQKTVVATFNIPSATAGTYYILAVVNPDGWHPQSNTANDVSVYPVAVTSTPTPTCAAIFVSETYPDNTAVPRGTAFQKSWTLRNSGTGCAWDSGFRLRFRTATADRLSASQSDIPVQGTVAAGGSYTFTVPSVAPGAPGTYREDWSLVDGSGTVVPVGRSQTVWTQIVVPPELAVTVNGAGSVTSAPAGIDCPAAACRHSFAAGTSVTLTASPGSGGAFQGWSGACSTDPCTIVLTADQQVTATFGAATFALTVTSSGTGAGTVASGDGAVSCHLPDSSPCSTDLPAGTQVTLTASPDDGNTFGGWSGACSGTGPCSVEMTQARSVGARFDPVPRYTLTAAPQGSGSGSITLSPGDAACSVTDGASDAPCSAEYDANTRVTLTAAPSAGSSFAGWGGDCTGTSPTCVLTMTREMSTTATFTRAPTRFTLTVAGAGTGTGTVTSSPPGVSCALAAGSGSGTCSMDADSGAVVVLTATPAASNTFAGWSGACTGTGTCTVTMSDAQNVIAAFTKPIPRYTLAVTGAGTGSGTVASTPGGVTCAIASGAATGSCAATLDSGTVVVLTATPAASNTFAGWSGACTGTGTCMVTMSAARTVTAAFTKPLTRYTLTVTGTGTGSGTVASTPSGVACAIASGAATGSCAATLDSGTVVVLTATPAASNTFTGWSGACTGTGTCTVTMSAARTVTAAFTAPVSRYTVSVAGTGTGSGSIVSAPAGIACTVTAGSASGACTGQFALGTSLTLTASPGTGSVFTGWSGACAGTSACTLVVSANASAAAAFAQQLRITSGPAMRGGTAGAAYADTMRATAPATWSITTGQLPRGLALDPASGVVSGVPAEGGNFRFTVAATAAGQQDAREMTLDITQPVLNPGNVVSQLFSGSGLTPDQVRYLDLIGNGNGRLDIGDVRAWLLLMRQISGDLSPEMQRAADAVGGIGGARHDPEQE